MTHSPVKLEFDVDASELEVAREALSPPLELELDLDSALELLGEFKRLLAGDPEFLLVELDRARAAGAGNCRVTIKPSDRLRELVAAVLASKRDLDVVND